MTKEEILPLHGEFTWNFAQQFYIETTKGNFIWSDPDYNGTNEIWQTKLTYKEWIHPLYGRSKGQHFIRDYCGKDIKVIEEPPRPGTRLQKALMDWANNDIPKDAKGWSVSLIELVKGLGIKSEHLDEMVHDIKDAEATQINNDGLESQLNFISSCYSEPELRRRLVELGAEIGSRIPHLVMEPQKKVADFYKMREICVTKADLVSTSGLYECGDGEPTDEDTESTDWVVIREDDPEFPRLAEQYPDKVRKMESYPERYGNSTRFGRSKRKRSPRTLGEGHTKPPQPEKQGE